MANVRIPYGNTSVIAKIPDRNLCAVLQSRVGQRPAMASPADVATAALDDPIGTPRLEELARTTNTVVVITSDHTRPVPSHITMPLLLERIRAGNPNAAITILVATGYHRATTHDELIAKFGADVVANEQILVHDSRDDSALVHCGTLPSGGELWLNRLAIDADLLVSEGFIEPHLFAGFSGGRKSVLPGIAGVKTVLANHCSEFISDPASRAGNLEGNPIHRDMLFGAEQAKLAFILNVALDGDHQIIHAVAGCPRRAHEQGCAFVSELSRVAGEPSDIVLVGNGGYPLDQNIYQATKGMDTAAPLCKKDGILIMVAECREGHGGQDFFNIFSQASEPADVTRQIIQTPREATVPDQWESQILARVLEHCRVILVSDACPREIIEAMHMGFSETVDEALANAFAELGNDARITVIPDGVSVIANVDTPTRAA